MTARVVASRSTLALSKETRERPGLSRKRRKKCRVDLVIAEKDAITAAQQKEIEELRVQNFYLLTAEESAASDNDKAEEDDAEPLSSSE